MAEPLTFTLDEKMLIYFLTRKEGGVTSSLDVRLNGVDMMLYNILRKIQLSSRDKDFEAMYNGGHIISALKEISMEDEKKDEVVDAPEVKEEETKEDE